MISLSSDTAAGSAPGGCGQEPGCLSAWERLQRLAWGEPAAGGGGNLRRGARLCSGAPRGRPWETGAARGASPQRLPPFSGRRLSAHLGIKERNGLQSRGADRRTGHRAPRAPPGACYPGAPGATGCGPGEAGPIPPAG